MSNPALRVLQVAAPARTGGLESVLVQLAAGLRGQGHAVHVAVVLVPGSETGHPVVEALRDTGVAVHPLVLGVRDYLGERRAVRQLGAAINADVVHTHGYRADAVDGGVARSAGRAHVMTLHGFVGGSRRGRFYEWLQIQAARRANAVVAVSQPIVDRLARHGIERNVHLLRNAVAPNPQALSREAAREALGLPVQGTLIGWVGRVSHEKGPDLFIRASAQLEKPASLVVLGDGPAMAEARSLHATLNGSPVLHAPGLVPQASKYLAAFDLLALTSRTEGTPMILLEAMWAGVPIVATSVGGVPQLLSNADAMLCAPDVESIARALNAALHDSGGMQQRAHAARARVAAEFAPAAWIARHEAIYKMVSAGATPR